MISALAGASPAGAVTYSVDPGNSLYSIADKLRSTPDSGTHVVQFQTYAKVGTFKLDNPPTKVETLIFERDPSLHSDSALRVNPDTALFEIKRMTKGTVILRGLAFHLTTPDARLLAGNEDGKANFNLVIDSCFFFGDEMNTSFLSWLGSMESRVEVKRSYFVFRKGSPTLARMSLSAKDILLANNLFNFPGQVIGIAQNSGRVEAQSNTFNRTQLRLNSETPNQTSYILLQNLIGYRGAVDAFTGTTDCYFLYATGFKEIASIVGATHMYPGWKGFDIVPAGGVSKFGVDTANNRVLAGGIKDTSELWDWYMAGVDTLHGHLDGTHRRRERYDIWPGVGTRPFLFEGNPAKANFKPVLFPRQWNYSRIPYPAAVAAQPSDIRIHSPSLGALHFGSFKVDSINLSTVTAFGRPVLLTGNPAFKFAPQRIIGSYNTPTYTFPNDSLTGRYYFLAFQGNTPRGLNVVPGSGSQLRPDDTLSFAKVDSAGYTTVKEEGQPAGNYPDSLRNLNRNMLIQTSASAAASDSITFGTRDFPTKPFLPAKVYWWHPASKALMPAIPQPDGKYIAKAPAPLPSPNSFSVFLVEKTNVKRGVPTLFPLSSKGELRVESGGGFQLAVDSTQKPDSLRFGKASPAYKFTTWGRLAEDVLILKLPGGPDVKMFRMKGDTIDSVAAQVDSTFLISTMAIGDTAWRYFTGIRWNVIANQVFNQNVQGVSVAGLKSATSGKLDIIPFEKSLLSQGPANILPVNYGELGAKGISAQFLQIDSTGYSVTFKVNKPTDAAQVEAYAWNGTAWRELSKPVFADPEFTMAAAMGLKQGDKAVLILERYLPAETYVTKTTNIVGRAVVVKTDFTNPTYQPIIAFSVIVQRIPQVGGLDSIVVGPMPIGQTAIADLTGKGGLFRYAIIYRTATVEYNRADWIYIGEFDWLPKDLQIPKQGGLVERAWHLIGYPYATSFLNTLKQGNLPSGAVKDTQTVLRLKSVGENAAWEPVSNEKGLKPVAGDAFLMSTARPYTMVIDDSGRFAGNGPKVLNEGGTPGWRFLSPPFPMSFPVARVASNLGLSNGFLQLVTHDSVPNSGKGRTYEWEPATTLNPFVGYAYLYRQNETLTFHPWKAILPPGVAKVSASEESGLKVILGADGVTRRMEFREQAAWRSIPFLPAPGTGPELRVGGKGGWLRKTVETWRGLDEEVRIKVDASQRARITLERLGPVAAVPDWQARLLDPVAGRIYDIGTSGEVALPAGVSEYRLLAGSGDFVRGREREFLAGLPAGLSLSQNFPNPFRRTTSITLDWPSLSADAALAGTGRKAWIEVFDTRGRRVHRMDLGAVRAGRQTVSLDASHWDSGLYTYRLTVASGSGRLHLQKKMLVAP